MFNFVITATCLETHGKAVCLNSVMLVRRHLGVALQFHIALWRTYNVHIPLIHTIYWFCHLLSFILSSLTFIVVSHMIALRWNADRTHPSLCWRWFRPSWLRSCPGLPRQSSKNPPAVALLCPFSSLLSPFLCEELFNLHGSGPPQWELRWRLVAGFRARSPLIEPFLGRECIISSLRGDGGSFF